MCSWDLAILQPYRPLPLGMSDPTKYEIPKYASIQIKENAENIDEE